MGQPIRDPATVYFCVDLEASGPVPGLFNLVSIGGVVVRLAGDRHVVGDSFYYEIKPDFEGFDPGAEAIHKLSRAHLEAEGRPAREVLAAITAFVKAQVGPGERPLFVGHNAPFDWMYTAWYFAWAGMENPFGYNALDTKALAMGTHRLPWKQTNKERLEALHPGLVPPDPDLVHNALADARFQADILIALLDA
ncbi:MAG: 3'-5' exonuclease [Myxococcales bacterium]|nr:3'-5' exonuclease [Myxococcales bacterium]MCB9549613.1 3'-5' exonuclease [Myxococcales bacterium]